METKQKALLFLTVAAFGYLGYEVYGLLQVDMSTPPPMVRSTRCTRSPQLAGENVIGAVPVANAAEMPARSPSSSSPASKVAELDTVPQKQLSAGQEKYLKLLQQYSLAKMEHRLLEERAAIAAAQHRIASLDEQTRAIKGEESGSSTVAYESVATNAKQESPYRLSYVDHQKGNWVATLNKNGRYYEVHVGSMFPDGSTVLDISRSGVLLGKGDLHERITFDGVFVLPKTSSADNNSSHLRSTGQKVLLKIVSKLENSAKVTMKAKKSTKQRSVSSTTAKRTAPRQQPIVTAPISTDKTYFSHSLLPETSLNFNQLLGPSEWRHKFVVMKVESPGIYNSDKLLAVGNEKVNDVAIIKKKLVPFKSKEHGRQKKSKDQMAVTIKKERHVAVVLPVTSPRKEKTAVSVSINEKKNRDHIVTKSGLVVKSRDQSTISKDHPKKATFLNSYTKDERRILAMLPHSYAIQLIGSYYREVVGHFARVNRLGKCKAQFYINYQGRKWYIILYGNYRTRSAARAALRHLPPSMAVEKPWIRRLDSVQSDIIHRRHRGRD